MKSKYDVLPKLKKKNVKRKIKVFPKNVVLKLHIMQKKYL